MAEITNSSTDNGNIIYNVKIGSTDSLTLATAGTYSDKNIVFNTSLDASSLEANLDDITYTFDTVADLKANAEVLSAGQTVQTLGYYAINDGGGAYYTLSSGTATSVLELQVSDNLYGTVYLEEVKYYNVLQFGAKRDGVTDTTEIIQNMLLAVPADSTLFFPGGNYLFSDSITPLRVTTYKGTNSSIYKSEQWDNGGTRFTLDSTNMSGKNFIDFQENATAKRGNIEDIQFYCDSYTATVDTSLLLTAPATMYQETINVADVNCLNLGYNNTIKNCTFIGWSGYAITGILRDTSWTAWASVDRCYFYHCKYGIESCIDSQFLNLRFLECYIGIVCDGSANVFTNIRMDSIGKTGLKMTGNRCGGNTITGLNVDVCLGAGLTVHGDHNYIQGNIGRCGGLTCGKSQSELTYDEIPDSCSIFLDDYDQNTTKENKIDVILPYGPLYEYDTDSSDTSGPAVLVAASRGGYTDMNLEIISNKEIDNSSVAFGNIFMGQSEGLDAPSKEIFIGATKSYVSDYGYILYYKVEDTYYQLDDTNIDAHFNEDGSQKDDDPIYKDGPAKTYFQGQILYNKQDYKVEDYTSYPFEINSVTLNNFFIGYARDADNRPPARLGTFMEHYWLDRYCISTWDSSTSKYVWTDIKNPAIDSVIHGSNTVPNAKETGTELSILRRRIKNLESALSASNITDVEYDDSWKSIGTKNDTTILKDFTFDLANTEIEVVLDLTNITSDNNPGDGTTFLSFEALADTMQWNSTGWHFYYAGLNKVQSMVSDLTNSWGGLYSSNQTIDFSKKLTIRINRLGATFNDVPFQFCATNYETKYKDNITKLMEAMVAAGQYRLKIGGNENVIVESIKIISYDMTDSSLGGSSSSSIDEDSIISVDDLKTYVGI